MKKKFKVRSSCGTVHLDELGNIVDVENEWYDEDDDFLRFRKEPIFAFDIDEAREWWREHHPERADCMDDEFDILDLGAFTAHHYEKPCIDWREDTLEHILAEAAYP